MSTTALGTWGNPPLAYVVAELVISPYYSLGERISGIQDRLRTAFPRTLEAKQLVLDGDKPSHQSVWQLMSADQKHAVQLSVRSIALHATSYKHSSEFLGRWAEVLDAIEEAKLGAFVERAGLRYVDLVVPSNDKSPSDYLAPGLKGLELEGARVTGAMVASAFQFDGCVVNLRAAAPSPLGILLPPDFVAMPLQKPSVMVAAEERIKGGGAIGFVDTDCLRDIAKVFVAGEMLSVHSEMQKLTSRVFKAALSDFARKEWM